MKQAPDNPSPPPADAIRCVNQACDRFDAAWKKSAPGGRQPRIEDFLAGVPVAVLPALLGELVTLDMYYRRRAGETPQPQEYQRRFPQMADLVGAETVPPAPGAGKRPQVLGPYELLQPLGAGGMGEVYKARHRHLDRTVALKLIHPDRLRDEAAVRRFVREIRAAAQLNHPNIVLAYDADQTDGTTFFVMEYVDGTDLAKLVKEKGPLSVGQACEAMRQAALGLQHAFEKGLIHRDIKPSNLLLTSKGVVKLLDLGLARWQTEAGDEHSTTLTETGAVMGTPDYIAPEQARADKDIDIRADLYSLGCTFYFLLTGRPPFPEGTLISKCLRHQTDEPELVEKLRPQVPPAVAVVVRRLMAKKPADRFQTPVELARALEELLPTLQGVQAARGTGQASNLFAALLAEPTAPQVAEARRLRREQQRRRWLRLNVLGGMAALGTLVVFGILLVRPWSGPVDKSSGPVEDAKKLEWKLGPAENALPGLIPRPAQLLGLQRWQLVTRAPGAEVLALAWGLNAEFLACGTAMGDVRLYDTQTRQLRHVFLGHTANVNAVAVSPDGKHLASASSDWTVRLWATNGMPGRVLTGHTGLVYSVAWSPDGKRLASTGDDSTVRLWEADGTAGPVLNGHTGGLRSVAWGPDSKRLASGSADGTIRLWEADGKAGPILKGHTDVILAVAWSPKGNRLASAGLDKTVRLWEADGKAGPVLPGHESRIRSLAWSPDGKQLASACQDNTVRLWQADGTAGVILPVYQAGSVAWHPDGKRLATGSIDQTIRLWATDGTPGTIITEGRAPAVLSVAWNPDGQRLAAGSENTVRLWKGDGTPGPVFKLPQGGVVAWHPDGKRLACSAGNNSVKLLEADGRLGPVLAGHTAPVTALAWSPDGNRLATSSHDQTVRLWKADGKAGPILKGHTGVVYSVAWNSDGKRLASASADRTVRLWEADGAAGPILKGHSSVVLAVAWGPDGKRLASASADRTVQLWEADGTLGPILKGHTNAVYSVVWNTDGKRLASASHDRTVRLWRVDGTPVAILRGHSREVDSVAWSPDANRIAAGAWGGMMLVWDANTAQPVWVAVLNGDGPSATFSGAGQLLHGNPKVFEKELVYVVEQVGGRLEVLKPSEFLRRVETAGKK